MREICFDTETTGLDPDTGDRLVEIGAVELINHLPTGKIYHEYINPERDVPEEVVKVHGLDNEFLKDKPVFRDVAQSWVDFIVKRDKDAKICIFGRSMGGATALMTSGLDLSKNVKTIVADSAYNSIDKQIRFTARKGIKVIPIPFIAFATYLFAKVFYKIDTKKPTSIQSAQKSDLPILLIHGTNDTFVPCEYSVEIFNAIKNDKREFKTYKDATHCGSLCRYEEDYKHTVLEFNKKYWND